MRFKKTWILKLRVWKKFFNFILEVIESNKKLKTLLNFRESSEVEKLKSKKAYEMF